MEFGLAYIGLLVYVATLAGMIGYHIGQRRASAINITVDGLLIRAALEAGGFTAVPRGVDWPSARRQGPAK